MLGSKKTFDFLDNNPFVEFHPTDYVNDPFVIAQNDKMVAINSAIAVDITGQVCADSMGRSIYSGFGGQVDFIRGARRSRGGKPIIALPSTAKEGTISRIVDALAEGSGVVTTRADVHYVVDRVRGREPARQVAARAGARAHRLRPPRLPGRAALRGAEAQPAVGRRVASTQAHQVPVRGTRRSSATALRPAPMARMTVAAPVTMSPPAKTPFFEVRSVSWSATAM